MKPLRRYRPRLDRFVVAVQLRLNMSGFAYHKWGAEQHCKRGDWIVDNEGDVYTVDSRVFERTYRQRSPGVYMKTTPVWAEVATQTGSIATKEGVAHYQPGDYLVYNNEDRSDGYCTSKEKFESLYEPT